MKIWSWSALLEACQKVIAVKNGPKLVYFQLWNNSIIVGNSLKPHKAYYRSWLIATFESPTIFHPLRCWKYGPVSPICNIAALAIFPCFVTAQYVCLIFGFRCIMQLVAWLFWSCLKHSWLTSSIFHKPLKIFVLYELNISRKLSHPKPLRFFNFNHLCQGPKVDYLGRNLVATSILWIRNAC